MKKAERLLDLIAFLLNTREPVSFDEIRSAFPEDYGEGAEEAIARKFERDKADIVAMGLPLKLRIGEEYEKEGYLIDRKSYGLEPIDLGPEELALLFLAGSAALDLESSPFETDLVLALNKIAYASGSGQNEAVKTPRALPTGRAIEGTDLRRRDHLSAIRQAIADRKSLTLSYHALWKDEVTTRKIDPYGLAWRRGSWLLVGHCQLRQAMRVFHLDRIRGLAINPLKPRTPDFEVPAGFKLADHVAAVPWQIRRHEPIRAVIRFEPPVAESVAAELGPLAAEVRLEGDARVLCLDASWLDGLLPTVLWYRDRAHVLEPAELVEATKAALGRMAAREEA